MLNPFSQAPLNQTHLAFLYAGPMSIGSRLRQLRKANKLSGDKFGELCGVTKGMVSQWESGQSAPPTDRLLELRKHLNFSFDWLLDGDDDDVQMYATSDPTLGQILKALEPRPEYLKETALKTVLSTIDLVDHAHADDKTKEPQPSTVRVRDRDLKKSAAARPAFKGGKKDAA